MSSLWAVRGGKMGGLPATPDPATKKRGRMTQTPQMKALLTAEDA